MISSVNLQEVKEKLFLQLKDTGWDVQLRSFLLGKEMDHLLEELLRQSRDGRHFTPPVRLMFRALTSCHFDNVKVVVLSQDPYPQLNTADGLAFSCSLKNKKEMSLSYIQKAIEKTVPADKRLPMENLNDLKVWADQGVLLLNSAFTTTINKPGMHHLLWQPLLVLIIDALCFNKPGLPYLFLGKKAQDYMDLIPDNNLKIAVSHPASAGYNSHDEWDCEDCFNRINKYLILNNEKEIMW